MAYTPRWVRSARRRPAGFLAILLLSVGAVLVSTITPMLLGAVDAATLRERVAAAPLQSNGISASALAQSIEDLPAAELAVSGALRPTAFSSDRWGPVQQVTEPELIPYLFGPNGRAPVSAQLSLAPDGCDGMRLTGSCPSSALEAVVPASIASSLGWTIGTRVAAKVRNPAGTPAFTTIGTIRIVGRYDDSTGLGRVLADPTVLVQRAASRETPNLVVGTKRVSIYGDTLRVTGGIRLVRPVRQADVPALRAAVDAAKRSVFDQEGTQTAAAVRTDLPALLDAIERQQAAAAVLAAPIGLEAGLLAWFALGVVAQRTARSRAVEWGVGRMRGATLRAWLARVFGEPAAAVLIGAVLGYALAVLASEVAAVALLGSADGVAPLGPLVLAGAGLAVLGSLIALAASSVRAATVPLPELLQDTVGPRVQARAALVAQVVVLSVAAAVAWAALTTSSFSGQQLGLLLPAMLALVAGLVASRLVVEAARRLARRPPRALLGLVVGRGLARAPSALATGQLVLVSAALAAYALQLSAASATIQTDQALLGTGASQVLTVRVPADRSLLDVVRRADPSGRIAMAAEQITGSDASAGNTVLAVDSSRLAAVSTWRPSWRSGLDLGTLAPDSAPDLDLRGTRLHVDLARTRLDAGDASASPSSPPPPIDLQVLVDGTDGWTRVTLGAIHDGGLDARIPCADGCRLVAFGVRNDESNGEPWSANLVITSMRTDEQPASAFAPWLTASRWRDRIVDQLQQSSANPAAADDGLAVYASDAFGPDTAQFEPAVGPALPPAILGSSAALVAFPAHEHAVIGTSLAGTPTLLRQVGRTVAVPRSLRTGVLVDLSVAQRATDPASTIAVQQVWLAPGEHPAVLARLRAAGVRVLDDERASASVDTGLRSATNRALQIATVTALAGIVFGLLALIATRIVEARARRADWHTLRLSGADDRVLRRLAVVQMAAPAGLGALLGVVIGSLSASLMLSRLPLLVGERLGPPLDAAPPLLALLGLAAGLLLLVGVAAISTTALEIRRRPR